DPDASAILTSLPVGRAEHATPMSYWPSYASATPDQRAQYLDWMATGRFASDIDIGYVFIFFYGLERRVLIDGQDDQLAREEVDRLFGMFAGQSASFRNYATNFLAFTSLRNWSSLDDHALDDQLGALAIDNPLALSGVLAWHHQRQRPLSSRYATVVALA